jgi:hypothetical protein
LTEDRTTTPEPAAPAPRENPVQQHLRELRERRYAAIVATIPVFVAPRLRRACERYAACAVANSGRRGLARVHWPWLEEPRVGRVARGRPRG